MMGCVAKVFDRRMCGTRTRASPDGGDVFKLVASAAGVGDKAPFLWAGVMKELWRRKGLWCGCKGKGEGLGGRCELM
jgi:hypothetical protein